VKITCFIQSLFIVALIVHNLHLDAAINNRNPSVVFHEDEPSQSAPRAIPQPLQPADYQLLPDIQDVQDAILQDRNATDDDGGPQGELFPENAAVTKKFAKNRK
jgi:hypothetical protein